MLKLFSFSFVLFLVFSCTLSGEQENRLNKQLSKFVKAYNDNNILEYAGLTHPDVVHYYSELGDSVFMAYFTNDPEEKGSTLYNPLFREMKSQGNWIERKYTVTKSSYEETNKAYELYAISSDGGENWFFLMEEDYFRKKIPLKHRLFSN